MAQRNTLRLDTSGFVEMLRKLDSLGGDVKKATQDALLQASETIYEDTLDAMQKSNLPAGGKYSQGTTMESIIRDAQVTWEGLVASVPVGFDFSKPGAGGFLITGTPKMQPDRELHRMYKQKKYMRDIQNDMGDVIMDFVTSAMEGD